MSTSILTSAFEMPLPNLLVAIIQIKREGVNCTCSPYPQGRGTWGPRLMPLQQHYPKQRDKLSSPYSNQHVAACSWEIFHVSFACESSPLFFSSPEGLAVLRKSWLQQTFQSFRGWVQSYFLLMPSASSSLRRPLKSFWTSWGKKVVKLSN